MLLNDVAAEDLEALEESLYSKAREAAWTQGDLRYKLHTVQKKIVDTIEGLETQEALILSSRQLGKSYAMCVYAIMFCIKNPGSIVRIAAPTLKQAQDIVADNLDPIIEDAPEGLVKRIKSAYRWQIGTSELRLGITERAHVDSLRGGNAKLVILEEGGFVTSDDYKYAVVSVIGPQLLHSGGKLLHVTSPSEEPEHYLHTEVLPKCDLNSSLFRFTIFDNPRLTEAQIDKARELCGGEQTIAWQREYLAKIIRDQSVVCVPEFSEAVHVLDYVRPEHSYYCTAIDTGGVRDKTVALLMTYDFLNAKVVVVDERIFDANSITDDMVGEIKAMESGLTVRQRYADAPGQLLVDLRLKHDYAALLPNKDDWEAGLNAVRLMMSQGKLLISSACPFLIQTLKAATFNKQRTDFSRSDALGHMDALAALMYGVRMIDKTSNPYPEPKRDFEHVFYPAHVLNKKTGFEKLATAAVKKNYMRKK